MKADSESSSGVKLLMAVVLLLLLALVVYTFQDKIIQGGRIFGTYVDTKSVEACYTLGAQTPGRSDRDFGISGDGFPDQCDICLGGDDYVLDFKGTQPTRAQNNDQNANGIPDACEDPNKVALGVKDTTKDPRAACIALCKSQNIGNPASCWNKERASCIRPCYKDGCPKP